MALVMAGGRGERMRASGKPVAKPLVCVGGVPLLERNLRMLFSLGFGDVWASVSAAVPEVGEWVEGRGKELAAAHGASVRCLVETEPLGTIGAAAGLRGKGEPVVVVNADNLISIDLRGMVGHHVETGASMTIATHREPFRMPFGELKIGADGRVAAYLEKPVMRVPVSSGTYVLGAEAIDVLPAGVRTDIPWLVDRLLERGRPVQSFAHESSWIDVNDAEAVRRAEEMIVGTGVFGGVER